jgi:hypothetical protein
MSSATAQKKKQMQTDAGKCVQVVKRPWAVEPKITTVNTSGSGCQDAVDTLDAATTERRHEHVDCTPTIAQIT